MPRSKIDRHRDQLLKNTSLEDLQQQLKQATKIEKTLKGGYSKARRGWKQLKEQSAAEIERRSKPTPLPTRQEICPHDDLDGRVACEHFLGKSLEEAEALFRESPIYYQSDLMWMGPVAFRYYLPAVVRFVRSEAATDDSDFIAHFASTLESRLEHEPQELQPVAEQLVTLCGYIVEHWSRFESGAEAYADVHTRYQTLQQVFSRLPAEHRRKGKHE